MPTFGPSSRKETNRGAHSGRLINCYRQPVPPQGMTGAVLNSVLGTEAFAETGGLFFKAFGEFKNELFAVFDGTLYKIDANGTVTTVGSVSSGQTSLSSNGTKLTIAANGLYYTVSGMTITNVTGVAFTSIGSVGFQGQYTLLTEKDGRKWAWSDLADPSTLPALNFATAESSDDDLIRVATINGRVILFKEKSREVWYNTNQAGADAFTLLPGGVKSTGLKGYNLLTETEDALFFIGNDNIARITAGGVEAVKFSYPPVDEAIGAGNPTDCFFYEDQGQKHVAIRFGDRPTWVLDLATAEWHERAETPQHDPWSVRGTSRINGSWYACTEGGDIWKLTRNNADVSGELRRTAVSETFYSPDRSSLDLLELYGRVGYSELTQEVVPALATGDSLLDSGDGIGLQVGPAFDAPKDAQMWIRLSRDGGDTWGPEKWRSLGTQGSHDQRMTWRSQGQFRQLTIEANVSDPAELPLYADYRMEAS